MPYCDQCGNYTSWIYPVGYSKGDIKNMCKECFNAHYRNKRKDRNDKFKNAPTINGKGEIKEND